MYAAGSTPVLRRAHESVATVITHSIIGSARHQKRDKGPVSLSHVGACYYVTSDCRLRVLAGLLG